MKYRPQVLLAVSRVMYTYLIMSFKMARDLISVVRYETRFVRFIAVR